MYNVPLSQVVQVVHHYARFVHCSALCLARGCAHFMSPPLSNGAQITEDDLDTAQSRVNDQPKAGEMWGLELPGTSCLF